MGSKNLFHLGKKKKVYIQKNLQGSILFQCTEIHTHTYTR